MSETPRNPGNQDQSPAPGGALEPLFLGADAPPLEGEQLCICGRLEGEHQVAGGCPESGCEYFVADDESEEQTRPDIEVEYDAGFAPFGGVR